MKITPLQLGTSHHLPLHKSGVLPPIHELFKRPSYFWHNYSTDQTLHYVTTS